MSKSEKEEFKMAIGAPTNDVRTYLCGMGTFVGGSRELLVHPLPIYRQKDYPNYQTRKTGPYVVTLFNSGLRISATAEKLVFPKFADAVSFAEAISPFFALYGLPVSSTDPRTVLEKARDLKEQVFDPMKKLAETHGAVFIQPQK